MGKSPDSISSFPYGGIPDSQTATDRKTVMMVDEMTYTPMIPTMLKTGYLLTIFTLVNYGSYCIINADEPNATPPLAQAKSSTHDLIKHLLAQDLGTRKFPFPDVVFASSGKKVIPFTPSTPSHHELLSAITKAANNAVRAMNAPDSPVRNLRRINEASRHFEDHLLQSLQKHPSLTCTIPRNTQGKEQRSGYPDLLITHTDAQGAKTRFYLDPKLFEKKSRASSLRTFYFEPRTRTNKIQYDATHLLLGISHDGNDGQWQFTGWEICDLSKFQVRLKAEFQASNRDLYRPHIVIKSSQENP